MWRKHNGRAREPPQRRGRGLRGAERSGRPRTRVPHPGQGGPRRARWQHALGLPVLSSHWTTEKQENGLLSPADLLDCQPGMVMKLEPRATPLLGRCSTTEDTPPSPVFLSCIQVFFQKPFCFTCHDQDSGARVCSLMEEIKVKFVPVFYVSNQSPGDAVWIAGVSLTRKRQEPKLCRS
ncbi:uncharacterized protein [Dipodomys merriami]|uniref:uncharacterized protein isoform X3 n=1 Tax=Dipodomys merriami TaxID=94247 RepID=UPI003855A0E2